MQLRQRKVIFESSFVDEKSHICWLSPLKFTLQTMKKAFGEWYFCDILSLGNEIHREALQILIVSQK